MNQALRQPIRPCLQLSVAQAAAVPAQGQLLRRKQLIVGSVLFHVGVLVIFFGHLVGLLTPIAIFDAIGISHGAKQLLAVVAGGIAGFGFHLCAA